MLENVGSLQRLKADEPLEADKETLCDISDIKIKEGLSQKERIADFLEQIKNPYLFRYKDMVVQSVFSEDGVTFADCMKQYFDML